MGFPGGAIGKELTCQCRRHKRCGFDPWVRKTPAGGHGNPLQYSCLKNHVDRGAWQAIVHRVAKGQTRLKQLNTHTHTHIHTHIFINFTKARTMPAVYTTVVPELSTTPGINRGFICFI